MAFHGMLAHAEEVATVAESASEHQEAGIHVAIAAEKLGEFLGIPITNALVTSWVVIGLLVIFAFVFSSRLSMVPGRLQTLVEDAFSYVYDYVAETLGSRELAHKFFPLLMTIFLFLFIGNMIHFVPGIGSIEYAGEPLLRAPATDLAVPLTLALISFIVVEITGILAIGAIKYGGKFVVNPFKNPMGFAVGLVELVSELVRVISLSFRLFGNILAGEVIIGVAIFFAPYLGPLPLMLFEIFIGFLQAAIFALLTLFYIKLAIEEPHGAEAH
ncbi:F0F1 ATP synthase subunit A [Candidatus Kaiserbacteria bacterium]|nr:F0F1 ATP synthase subunit A [Candidatus Kaiserbacteria bacterium]